MVEIDKTIVPTKLLWVDLEMTGLDPKKDVILEVAAEITDFNFIFLLLNYLFLLHLLSSKHLNLKHLNLVLYN